MALNTYEPAGGRENMKDRWVSPWPVTSARAFLPLCKHGCVNFPPFFPSQCPLDAKNMRDRTCKSPAVHNRWPVSSVSRLSDGRKRFLMWNYSRSASTRSSKTSGMQLQVLASMYSGMHFQRIRCKLQNVSTTWRKTLQGIEIWLHSNTDSIFSIQERNFHG